MSSYRFFIFNTLDQGLAITNINTDFGDDALVMRRIRDTCHEFARPFLENPDLVGEELEKWRAIVHRRPRRDIVDEEGVRDDSMDGTYWPVYDGPEIYTFREVIEADIPQDMSQRANWFDDGQSIVVLLP